MVDAVLIKGSTSAVVCASLERHTRRAQTVRLYKNAFIKKIIIIIIILHFLMRSYVVQWASLK